MNNQREEVLRYIKDHGSITSLKASQELHITQLSARIGELEKEGWTFERERISGVNTYGRAWHGFRYKNARKRTPTESLQRPHPWRRWRA
jgi:predicted ArsR family transcriptional regulator